MNSICANGYEGLILLIILIILLITLGYCIAKYRESEK